MDSQRKENYMDYESVPRLMLRYTAPALAGMFASALYNIVDRVFVGRIVGPQGIAAIALSFPCMLFFFCAAILIGAGAASRVSILMGEKKTREAERTMGNSVTLALIVGALLTLSARAAFAKVLKLSGASEELFPMASEYLSVINYGIIFGIMSFSLSYQIRACGSPVYAMGTQIAGAVSNIVLDALFVIKFGMGVRGAAIATVVSQGISLAWALAYFWLPGAALRLRPRFMAALEPAAIRRIFAVGTPSSLTHLNFVFVHGLITSASSKYGGDLAVSATGILMGLDSLLFMPAVSVGEACTPIIGYNYGAGRIDRVMAAVKNGIAITTVFYLISFGSIMSFAENMAAVFNSDNAELIALTARCMRCANIGIPVMSVSIICTSLLQGLGYGREGMALAAIRFGLFLWAPLLILPKIYGLMGVWGSFPISDICGTAASGLVMAAAIKRLRAIK